MKPILTAKQSTEALMPGFTIEAVAVPSGESYDYNGKDCDPRSLLVPSTNGVLWLWVRTDPGRQLVGWAVFGAGDSTVMCSDVFLDEGFRGEGIAYAFYHWVACRFAAPVVPAPHQTDLAEEFWRGRAQLGC